jgi:glycyl-tRNA synthetase (class II)
VTLRHRDSMQHVRIKIEDIPATIRKATKEYQRV